MTSTDFLDAICEGLFRDYPLAVTPGSRGEVDRSMVLMLRDGYDTDFFVLSRGSREGQPF